ncbi:MAG TPA: sugar phosphate isomerase/epimerase family protein [Terriglobia bacterium]|nr:sugar phosphate isomerase/epimerase family protein [Terriglobia bacterium]
MTDKIARRGFLKVGGLAVAGAMAAGCAPQKQTKPASAGAAQSPSSEYASREPRLLPGCCAYSFHDRLAKGTMTYEEFLDKVVEMGSTGADMTVYWFKSTDPGYLENLRHLAFRKGVPLSGASCGSSMVQATAAERNKVLADIKKWVDVADRLGASHLRIFGGELPKGATVKQGADWCVELMKPACDYSGKKGITLGIEDHGGVTQNSDVCLEIMHRVDSPYARINLDITNFVATPQADAYAQIKACLPFASHSHIRDHFADGSPVDLDRVWRLFAETGYKGFMSAEYEGKEDSLTGVPKLMDKIKTLCRKYSTA